MKDAPLWLIAFYDEAVLEYELTQGCDMTMKRYTSYLALC